MSTTSVSNLMVGSIKRGINAILSPLDLQITRVYPNQACTLQWLEEAKQAGMEINEFIEKDQLKPALKELEHLVFPHISPSSRICELGPGSGCYTRHLNSKITQGEFHIVDSDSFAIEFLKTYLPNNPATQFHLNSGTSLPFAQDAWLDLGFCTSMFTGVNLTYFFRYLQEFARVLKPGGYFIFDHFDISTEAGWNVLIENMAKESPVYAYNYHATETIDKIASLLGFRIVDRYPTIRGSVFITAQKL